MPRNARNHQKPAPGPPEGAQPCDTWNSDFCVPELGKNWLLCFRPPGQWCFVTGAPESRLSREKAGGIGVLFTDLPATAGLLQHGVCRDVYI